MEEGPGGPQSDGGQCRNNNHEKTKLKSKAGMHLMSNKCMPKGCQSREAASGEEGGTPSPSRAGAARDVTSVIHSRSALESPALCPLQKPPLL